MVYEYQVAGQEPFAWTFQVSANRGAAFPVVVCLEQGLKDFCEQQMGSALRWNDEYALAKLALFDAFDRVETLAEFARPVCPSHGELIGYMKTLRMVNDDE